MNETEQAIDEIKNGIREIMQLLVQRGQPLSEDLKIKVVNVDIQDKIRYSTK